MATDVRRDLYYAMIMGIVPARHSSEVAVRAIDALNTIRSTLESDGISDATKLLLISSVTRNMGGI